MKTAVIVAGAGAMGWFEMVALKVYLELKLSLKLDYDFIFGTSSGGLNAAMFHAGQMQQLEELWLTIQNRNVFRDNPLDAFGKDGSLCDNWPLKSLIISSVDFKALKTNPIPLIVNVANLYTSQIERLSFDDLDPVGMASALLQTAAIPVLFPQVNGKVDGGILCDFPISEVLLDDVDRILIFSGLYPSEKVQLRNLIEVASAAIHTMLLSSLVNGMQAVAAMNQVRATINKKPIELVMIQPQKDYGIGLIDFDGLGNRENRMKLFTDAYQQIADQLKSLAA